MRKCYESKGIQGEQFVFSQTTILIITKMFRGLHTNKSPGLDGIPARFLRDAAEVIASYVTQIINFPNSKLNNPHEPKKASFTALHKKSNKFNIVITGLCLDTVF